MKFIFLFVDGVGIGINDPKINPLTRSQKQILNHFQDVDRTHEIPFQGLVKGLDANLNVEGLPQSATGQTTLFSGINASKHSSAIGLGTRIEIRVEACVDDVWVLGVDHQRDGFINVICREAHV